MALRMTPATSGSAVSRRPAARAFTAVRPVSSRNVASRAATAEAPKATKEWSALVCNSDFFFNDPQNESIAEQLRERVRFYKEQNRDTDFYLVADPKWLDAKFPELGKQVKRPCVALVSTDKTWITFMKLRIDRVLKIDLKDLSDAEVLAAGGEVPDFPAPAKWTAPYARYTPGWWKAFYPPQH
ncbi:hypothetical protein GPECTOR_19g291 [Gonium pectorale]|uniref:Uncharacterized protein n=1 Tax=Gonium pectorale TaxID=33097 RepID=A0A150GKG3_GONPE|nr:hypothetical protein GPECTOR_19g291 [Gonium pectorale]|eukprot:KXZ49840.1 hypothetical protein GPECTOR_19g291 [Gonium pectorale]